MKILAFGASCVVVILVAFFFVSSPLPKEETSSTPPDRPATRAQSAYRAYPDTDGDGRPDWEERLQATDPMKPDTEKNAVPEIIARLEEKRATTAVPAGAAVVTPSIVTLPATLVPKEKPSPADTALRAFGNAVADVFDQYLGDSSWIATAFETAVKSPSAEAMAQLEKVGERYEATASALAAIAAPSDAVAKHTAAIAGFRDLAGAIRLVIAETKDDHVLSGQSFLTHYNEAAITQARTLFALDQYFKTRGVVFSAEESGRRFNF